MVLKLAKKAPSKQAAPAKKAAAKKVAPRRVDDDDDEPTPAKKTSATKATPGRKGVVTSGWDGAKGMGGSGDFIKALDFKNEADRMGETLYFVGKFIDDEPFANVKIHWTDRKGGKKSFVCIGEDCPLCNIGADVKTEMRFNFAWFTDSEPKLRAWAAGWKIFKKIEQYSIAPLTKPLSKRYYIASRTGKQFNEIAYDLQKVTEEEINEGYPDIYVPTTEEIEELGRYTKDDVVKEYSTLEELEEIAAEIVEG